MLTNYLKIALRTFRRRAGYAAINVAGLTLGIACCLLILQYVAHERRYDRFHESADRIVRVEREHRMNDADWTRLASAPYLLAPILEEGLPGVERVVRLAKRGSLVAAGDRSFREDRFFFADSSVFDVFTVRFVRGDPETALDAPFTVVLTEETARRYFGDDDPLGRTLSVERARDFTVTGVVEALPEASHFHFDMLASLASTRGWYGDNMFEEWGAVWTYTYLLLRQPTRPDVLDRQLAHLIEGHLPPLPEGFAVRLRALPLTGIHLYGSAQNELEPGGDAVALYLFGLVAVFILLIACINFMNLATARATWRAKEVGVRKVMGAHRRQLVGQFLGEAMLMSGAALVLAVALARLALPVFNDLAGVELAFSLLDARIWPALVALALVVGGLAGGYPAFYLARFQPAAVLKGGRGAGPGRGAAWFRRVLVVFQFALSIALLVATAVVFAQLGYVRDLDLGFDREHVVSVDLNHREAREAAGVLKAAFEQSPGVEGVSAASNAPPDGLNSWWVRPEGQPRDEAQLISVVAADEDYVDLLALRLAEGRAFSEERPGDAREALMLNEAAVRALGLREPVGQRLVLQDDWQVTVVGVLEDYHTASLHEEIAPLIVKVRPDWYNRLLVRVSPDDLRGTLAYLERQWKALAPGGPFEYAFLDSRFEALYRAEERQGRVFGAFALLAIFVACLGLLGLSAFTAEQRTKEIGIRKVLGARISQIVLLLTGDFVRLVAAAFVVAAPLAYLAMQRWLDGFAYRVELSWGIFVVAGLAALAVAVATVSVQALRAAAADPAVSLRYE